MNAGTIEQKVTNILWGLPIIGIALATFVVGMFLGGALVASKLYQEKAEAKTDDERGIGATVQLGTNCDPEYSPAIVCEASGFTVYSEDRAYHSGMWRYVGRKGLTLIPYDDTAKEKKTK